MQTLKRFRKRHQLSQAKAAELISDEAKTYYQSDWTEWENDRKHMPKPAADRFIAMADKIYHEDYNLDTVYK
jgi:transcriptional regulator with XRE-family HTH domain